jgi:hypothetical protein
VGVGVGVGAMDLRALLTDSAVTVRCRLLLDERVAQLVEHLTFNQEVPGSSPGALTSYFSNLDE